MFDKQTLFILGAGASCPYGYPIGNKLVSHIVQDMSDEILIPRYSSSNRGGRPYWNGTDVDSGYLFEFAKISENLEQINGSVDSLDSDKIYDHDDNHLNLNCSYANGNSYYRVKINQINIFNNLLLALDELRPISIDIFLRDNPSHAIAGKSMILYSLLKRENRNIFNLSNINIEEDDHWYSLLLNDMVSSCADNPRNLLKNRLDFLTFNYDVSLDFYIASRLGKTELFSSVANEYMQSLSLEHIYGKLRVKDIDSYGSYCDVEEKSKKTPIPFNSLSFLVLI